MLLSGSRASAGPDTMLLWIGGCLWLGEKARNRESFHYNLYTVCDYSINEHESFILERPKNVFWQLQRGVFPEVQRANKSNLGHLLHERLKSSMNAPGKSLSARVVRGEEEQFSFERANSQLKYWYQS